MTRRTIVLLGAGASFDAGLPLTSQLAEKVVAKFNVRGSRLQGVPELNFVYSAMIGHQGEDGSDPLRAVNIETLISAVRLLQARESHEVAPFVSSWKAGALGFSIEPSNARQHGREVRAAVLSAIKDEHWGGESLADLIAGIATEAARTPSSSAYQKLEVALLHAIRDELLDIKSVDYLRPLAELAAAQSGGLDIVTLNYDLTIETMAAAAGVTVDRGIDRWEPGAPLAFGLTDGQINLYKLHGSVDWELTDRHPRIVHPPMIQILEPEPERDPADFRAPPRRQRGLPWIVVGDREKLATDGPTLDLLAAAREALNRADSLVVVGYSFADQHVNAMVRNWMAGGSHRTLTVIDPMWPSYRLKDPRAYLAREYGGSDEHNKSGPPPRLAVIPAGAADALELGLTTLPARPEPYAEAEWRADGVPGEVVIRLRGPSLLDADVSGAFGPGPNVSVGGTAGERDDQLEGKSGQFGGRYGFSAWSTARLGGMEQGAEVSVFPLIPEGVESIYLTLEGDDLIGRRLIHLELADIPADAPRLQPPTLPEMPRARPRRPNAPQP